LRVSVFTDRDLIGSTRVWLDDVEVTFDCQIADDERGEVVLLKRNAEGQRYVDSETHEAATETRHGRVRIEIGSTH
jgi:hypothetical protein